MIKLSFGRSSKGDDSNKSYAMFLAYCQEERERRRDAGSGCDEELFQAAVDLALARLQALEQGEGKA